VVVGTGRNTCLPGVACWDWNNPIDLQINGWLHDP